MSASLVGSEMCIRDRQVEGAKRPSPRLRIGESRRRPLPHCKAQGEAPVSYTHLTLPTICSV
eukprot:10437598-Alexandrium_andersonii.AAC.1